MVGHGNCCFNQQTWGTHTEDIMEMGPVIHWFNGVVGAISPLWKTGCTQLTNGGLDSGAWIHTGLTSHGGLHTAILFSLCSRALMLRPCIVSEETHGNCTPQNLKLVRTSVSILTSFNQPRSKRSRNWWAGFTLVRWSATWLSVATQRKVSLSLSPSGSNSVAASFSPLMSMVNLFSRMVAGCPSFTKRS